MNILDKLEKRLQLEQLIIGLEEPVLVKGLGSISAKIDSGNAGFNVIHGEDFQIEGNILNFTTFSSNGEKRRVQYPIEKYIDVNIGSGNIQHRPVILLNIKFAGEDYKEIPFSVTDRSLNSNPILISKEFVQKELNALIDVSKTNISLNNIQAEVIGEASDDNTSKPAEKQGFFGKVKEKMSKPLGWLHKMNQAAYNYAYGGKGSIGELLGGLLPLAFWPMAKIGSVVKSISRYITYANNREVIKADRTLLLASTKNLIERYKKQIDPKTQKSSLTDENAAQPWINAAPEIQNYRIMDYLGKYYDEPKNGFFQTQDGKVLKSEEKRIETLKKFLKNVKALKDPNVKKKLEQQEKAADNDNYSKDINSQEQEEEIAEAQQIISEMLQLNELLKSSGLIAVSLNEASADQQQSNAQSDQSDLSKEDCVSIEEMLNLWENRQNFILYYLTSNEGPEIIQTVFKNHQAQLVQEMDKIIAKPQFNTNNFSNFVRYMIRYIKDIQKNVWGDASGIIGVCYGKNNGRKGYVFEKDHNLLFLKNNAESVTSQEERLRSYTDAFVNFDIKLLDIDDSNVLYQDLVNKVGTIQINTP